MQWKEFRSHVHYLPEEELTRIQRAFETGKKMHGDQKRKSGEPYFTHPIAVAHLLASWGADADTIIAALLHDTVEDTPYTLQDVRRDFDATVGELIDGVTKMSDEELSIKPTVNKQIETLRKIFSLMQSDVRIMVIKLADRLHNMQTSEFVAEEKRKSLARETMDVYVKIADRLSMWDVEDELERLCLAILDPEEYKQLVALRKSNNKLGTKILQEMQREIHEKKQDKWDGVIIENEQKKWTKLQRQLQVEGSAITGLSAVSIVFICPDIDTCYRVMGTLHQIWKRETLSFEDYINSPTINGYKALHTTLILSDGTRVRCKIRTQDMQDYAHKGITTYCFTTNDKGIADFLPWTKSINPLTTATKDRSQDFWASLQSDILGDHITIHGPSDSSADVPKDATALDALFYLFQDQALRTSVIRVNGKEVPFDSMLKHGDSVTATFKNGMHDHRTWLQWTNTGMATAAIRRSLAAVSQRQKIETGKEMLEKIMRERRVGLVDEFNEKHLLTALRRLGYESMNETFIAIANGELDPSAAFQSIFQDPNKIKDRKEGDFIVTYTVDLRIAGAMDRMSLLHKKYVSELLNISYVQNKAQEHMVRLRCRMSPDERNIFMRELETAGAHHINIETVYRGKIRLGLCAMLLLIWGMDPVFAHMILEHGVSPVDFTIVRMISIFLIAVMAFILSQFRYSFSPLPLRNKAIWISGLSFFAVGFLTYVSLQTGSPSLYNSILRGNALLIGLASVIQHRRKSVPGVSMLIMGIGYFFLLLTSGFTMDVIMSLGVLAAFFIYTLSSTYFQEKEKVLARYPQFFLYTSGIALLCTLLISTKSTILQIPLLTLGALSLYSACFIGAPYILFFWLTKKYGYAAISPWIAWSLVVTFIGEASFYGLETIWRLIPAAILLIVGSLLSSREKSQRE